MGNDDTTQFMRTLEEEFRIASGLPNRSAYKIYYGRVQAAPILTLGINPGGSPDSISADGTRIEDGRVGSSSATYYENAEHDILDCEWAENNGLRKLLMPLVGNDRDRFRHNVVKTNLAFRRSRRITDIDREAAYAEAQPFLQRILARVSPRVIILTGAPLGDFIRLHAEEVITLTAPERDPTIGHVVFAAADVRVSGVVNVTTVVQVAHASQFAWTYTRYGVADRIRQLMQDEDRGQSETLTPES